LRIVFPSFILHINFGESCQNPIDTKSEIYEWTSENIQKTSTPESDQRPKQK
jgi:hypothetical protein